MNRQEFQNLFHKTIILDGATGSNLQKRGMPTGICPEKWIVEHKDIILDLQREYVEAGATILYAPTFSGNRIKLLEYGLENEIEYLNKELVSLSKEAADGKAYVAGDITMTGEQLVPFGTMELEELIEIYKEQISYLVEAGVDLLVIETMLSLGETRAAVIAAKEICDLPIMVTMTFNEDGRTFYGTSPESAVVVLESLGVNAVGVNCSTGPDKMIPLIEKMQEYAGIPIIAKPNAGLPFLDEEGNTSYDMDVKNFVKYGIKLLKAGAAIIGGCCGTTPEYIAALAKAVENIKPAKIEKESKRILSTERSILEIDRNGKFLIVGERINPTGKKDLQKELKNHEFDIVLDLAGDQVEAGASILDVNVGMNGIDEKEIMLEAISEISFHVDVPLCIDSSHIEVIEAVLRNYPGRALINSISLEKEKFERLIPIAAKYGAMFILLPLSDKGLPKSVKEKIEIVHIVMESAISQGMKKEDIIVDGLVTTVGANKNAAIETLELIKYCKEHLDLATIVGLSNISFGLPERTYVNSAFLTMAIHEGLTMAIANPSQELLVRSAFASDLLMNKENADIAYIQKINSISQNKDLPVIDNKGIENENLNKDTKVSEESEYVNDIDDIRKEIYEAVLKGSRKIIVDLVSKGLDLGIKANTILNDMLIPGINQVGNLFDAQIYFLPQLIASAETMKKAVEYLELLLKKDSNSFDTMPAIVLATVEGDIHDIGKNLVGLMLKNYGYQVIDLGKDVSKEKIVEAAIKYNAAIIGLSALMTTTMQEMKNVIKFSRDQGVDAKIIIGGAVITKSYADEIHADGYSKDAAEAVKLVQALLS